MSKFKVGDKVIVHKPSKSCFSTDYVCWVDEMNSCAGNTYTIDSIDGVYHTLNTIAGGWSFSEEWLDLAFTTSHVHCELIKAWADGAEIEAYSVCKGECIPQSYPSWHAIHEYRIRPNKTDKELQIEKLELQAKQLAEDISKLKGM